MEKGVTNQSGVANQLAGEPQEGLLEVVVGLRRDLEVLDVLLAVESDVARLNFPLLDKGQTLSDSQKH